MCNKPGTLRRSCLAQGCPAVYRAAFSVGSAPEQSNSQLRQLAACRRPEASGNQEYQHGKATSQDPLARLQS
jgi:hypothetical protein